MGAYVLIARFGRSAAQPVITACFQASACRHPPTAAAIVLDDAQAVMHTGLPPVPPSFQVWHSPPRLAS